MEHEPTTPAPTEGKPTPGTTSGPWEICTTNIFPSVFGPYEPEAKRALVVCRVGSQSSSRQARKRDFANARLIAAAPELLSILKRAIADQRLVETMQGMVEWYDAAEAIIEKATGGAL